MVQGSDQQERPGRMALPAAIQGTFIPVSPKKHRVPSPQRHKPNKSVQINLNLTENQMERLTDVFVSKTESPPSHPQVDNTTLRSPLRGNKFAGGHSMSRIHGTLNQHEPHPCGRSDQMTYLMGQKGHESDSTTFSELMPRSSHKTHQTKDSLSSDLAERRRQQTPTPINIRDRRQYGTIVENTKAMPPATSPMTPQNHSPASVDQVDSSSIYSQDEGHPSPLCFPNPDMSQHIKNVLQSYSGWKDLNAPTLAPEAVGRGASVLERGPPKGKQEALRQQDTGVGQMYSPLRPYFAHRDLPVQKIAGKTLIGEQGWLERPEKTSDRKKKDSSPKKPGLLDSLKKIAKEMTEGKPNRKFRDAGREWKVQRVNISLDPREQSLLYCELEFHISNALHSYIANELNHGRLNPDKLKKIADGWNQKGRPRVVGFRYDLETQLDLVHLHIDEFRFFGRRQGNPLEITGLLHAMKVNARSMRIRTYCQPDSVIAKQLVDSQSLCNTIGCSDAQQIAIAEIAQFFKVIVEREQAYREMLARDNAARTVPHGQGVRQWETSRDLATGVEPYEGLHPRPEGYNIGAETLR
ncbi:hypothetical protein CMUS01_12338 [Colletotrichum musicola]|uniref:Uncharacterized protein n=1 Tax=Colletotrichum musicola TaxID=2175873 RepID=A0A8H6JNQ8_9PEZI|nr:hypothetical protein CMUS01_12338 [Colletotrichum musicola]